MVHPYRISCPPYTVWVVTWTTRLQGFTYALCRSSFRLLSETVTNPLAVASVEPLWLTSIPDSNPLSTHVRIQHQKDLPFRERKDCDDVSFHSIFLTTWARQTLIMSSFVALLPFSWVFSGAATITFVRPCRVLIPSVISEATSNWPDWMICPILVNLSAKKVHLIKFSVVPARFSRRSVIMTCFSCCSRLDKK